MQNFSTVSFPLLARYLSAISLFTLVLVQALLGQAPTITSFTPASGGVGTLVSVTGTNLSSPTALNIGGIAAVPVSNDGTTLVAMVMPGATTGAVSVSTAGGSISSGSNFSVASAGLPANQDGAKLTGTGQLGAAQFGQSVAVSADGNTAAIGAWQDNSNMGAVFVFVKSGGVWAQQAKLVGTGGGSNLRQGTSVAISADGNTIITGEYQDVCQEVYIFTRTGTTWSQEARIPNPGERFGSGLSLSADGNTAAIGGFYAVGVQGRTWVYTRTAGVWSLQQQLAPSNINMGLGGPLFGYSNSLSADGNTLAVGAPGDGDMVVAKGAVYVFVRSGGTWTLQSKTANPAGLTNNASWGNSVAISADGNTFAAGAPVHNNPEGAVLVYTRSGVTWSQEAFLTITGRIGWAAYGGSVSLSADGNTLVQAGNADNANQGACWLFTRSGTTWTQKAKLIGTGNTGAAYQGYGLSISADGKTLLSAGPRDASSTGAVWAFSPPPPPAITSFTPASGAVGTLVSITGTNLSSPTALSIGGVAAIPVSNDGTTLVAMVMPGATTGAVSVSTADGTGAAGSNFVVTGTGLPISQDGAKLTGTGQVGAAQFGQSVAVSADGNTAAVGAWQDNSNRGAVFVFVKSGGVWSQQAKLIGAGAASNVRQGTSVAISADGNTIISGEYQDFCQEVYIFTRTGTTWSEQARIPNPGVGNDYRFGSGLSLSADGSTAAIGGFYAFGNQGRTWVYTRTAGVWSLQQALAPSNINMGLGGPLFGYSNSLSADGNTLAVGAPGDGDMVVAKGAVYVFVRSGGTWTLQSKTANPAGLTNNASWGNSVAISADGNTFAAGAPVHNNPEGAVLVYTRSGITWSQEAFLTFTGRIGWAVYGGSVSLSADGNTLVQAGNTDNTNQGACWLFTRSGTTWTQKAKLIGTGNTGAANQGYSLSISADGKTLLSAGPRDASSTGAVWVFTPPPPPTITSFTPSVGCPSSASITITGTNFIGVSAVTIGGTAVSSFTVNAATEIVAVAGTGTTGTIEVTAAGGTVTSAGVFTMITAPNAAIVAGGPTAFCTGGNVSLNGTTLATNNALSFDGTTSGKLTRLSGGGTIPTGNSPYTMEMWVKPDNITGANGLVGWGNWGNNNEVNAFRFNGPTQLINSWWGNDLVVNIPFVLDGNWHHVAATFDGTTRKIYFDGALQGQDTPTGHNVPNNDNVEVGTTCPDCDPLMELFLEGQIDELRIWNVGRSASQIASNMNSMVAANSSGLVAYFSANEGAGGTTTDIASSTVMVLEAGASWTTSTAPVSPYTYLWTPGSATTPVITASSTGSYTVRVTSTATGCYTISTPVVVTAYPLATATISGTTAVCKNGTSPAVTFTGVVGTAPFTFTYKVNGGGNQTVATSSGNSVTVSAPTGSTGTFTYSLVSVSDANGCAQSASGSAIITVNTLPAASIFGGTSVCQNATAPSATFLGSAGTAPYTFTYQVNGGSSQTATTVSGSSISVSVPTSTVGAFAYSMVSVSDAKGCSQSATGTATISVVAAPSATVTPSGPTIFCPGGSVTLATNAGVANKDITFDGATNATCGNDPVLQGNNGTIEAWIKTGDAGSGLRAIVVKPFAWGLFLNDNKVSVYDWTIGSGYTGAVALNDNVWHHVAFTFRNGVAGGSQVYVDGVAVGSSFTFTINAQTDALEIGDNSSGVGQEFNGEIDEVRVWNTARTASQINSNKGKIIAPTTTGLMAYYRLDEGSGTTLTDLTGKGNTGTLAGTPVWGSSTAPVISVQYLWSPGGATTPSISQGASGSYTVSISDVITGCAATSAATAVTALDVATANVVAGPSQTISATHECTDGSGWTHYFNGPGNQIVLSIKKGSNNIGAAGGTLTATSYTTPNWGSNTGAHITAPYVTNASGWYIMNRWWNVAPQQEPATDVQVRSYFTPQDLADVNGSITGTTNDIINTQLRFYKMNNNGATVYSPNPTLGHSGIPSASAYDQAGYWEYSNGVSASQTAWALGTLGTNFYAEYTVAKFSGGGGGGAPGGAGAFPVEWLSFEGRATQAGNLLTWTTASESNNAGFRVEKSLDGSSFTEIGFVAGGGNSTSALSYDYLDAGSSSAWYRLRQMDMDGNANYSATINITADGNAPVGVYPNPVRDVLVLENGIGKVMIFNAVGQQLLVQPVSEAKATLDLSGLPAGVYTLQLVSSVGQHTTVQLVK